ncbi:hypothetical protein PIB30_099805 [Stylosanthes scabra]|uniref:Uncharacterized protein n=1 Tax=Stylosanthes scabra TaxID=79078 RepID=A0ABU6UVV8_9FABA|nr:hypothetical protein [Stylosanthes scabra]
MLWDSQRVVVVCSRIEVVYAWTCPMWEERRGAGKMFTGICVELHAYAWKQGSVWGSKRKVEKLRVANGLDWKKVKMATHMRRDRRICVGGGGDVMDMEVDRGCFRRVEGNVYAYA